MNEFRNPTTIAKVMAVAGATASFDTSIVHGFEYRAPQVIFYTAAEGSLMETKINAPTFDAVEVAKTLC